MIACTICYFGVQLIEVSITDSYTWVLTHAHTCTHRIARFHLHVDFVCICIGLGRDSGCGYFQALSAVSAQIQRDSQVSSFLKQDISLVRCDQSCGHLALSCIAYSCVWFGAGGAEC